jgi:hypothetical protein
MARGTEFCYALGNIFYALGAANGSTAVFLNKKSHDMLCVEYLGPVNTCFGFTPPSADLVQPLNANVKAQYAESITLHVKRKIKIGEADNFN